jgi:hypothetical protein
MTTWKMKNGTPVGAESLCGTCSNALVMRGYRETEALVYCIYVSEQVLNVPFKIRDCSGYRDKTVPARWEMEEMALIINEATSAKPAGFRKSGDEEREVATAGFRKSE